jgi:perosamine synthetase
MTTDAERTRAVRRDAVLREIAFLKSTDTLAQVHARSIGLPSGGVLLPVCELHADDESLISDLARWRAAAQFAFPTRFPVSTEGTRRWLRRGLLDVADRVLFLVCDRHGHVVGHLGFAVAAADDGSMEIDNVVRGQRAVAPGLMGEALDALIAWAEELFAPERILLRVFEDNGHAIGFYRRHGFRDAGRVPLTRMVDGDRETFVPADGRAEDAAFLVMDWHAPATPAGEQILTAGPSVSARESAYVLDAARTGWNATWSGYLDRLESAFAEYVGADHAIATSSCTGALHLAVAGAGIGPGDEVIVPELTWVATASAVLYRGGTPVFADVEPDSWCIDPDSVRSLITPRTKAIMPVHLYGHPAQADIVCEIAAEHGLTVIEDAAPAIGAELRGRRVGTFGDVACFSFQGAKLLVTGEGGMIVSDDDELVAQIRSLWDHGRDRTRAFWIEQLGFKYKMSNLQAAFGLGQLERVDQLIEAKRRIFAWYREGLEEVPGIILNDETSWARSIYWMTSIRVGADSGLDREALTAHLREARIDTRPVYTPISQYPFWPRRQPAQPVATAIGAEGINLPSGVTLRRAQVERVCAEIRRAVDAASRRAA